MNIATILKDKPKNTKLYSPIFGDVYFLDVEDDIIKVIHQGKMVIFFGDGRYYNYPESEPLLFPSKEMRDWEKFAWKRGDALIMNGCRVVFDKWLNDDYTRFNAIHLITFSGGYFDKPLQNRYTPISSFITKYWRKMTDLETKIYIESLERECSGKLNLTTLNIEKQPEFKDGDIAFADYGNRQNVFIVSDKTALSEGYNSFISLDLNSLTLSMGYRTTFFKKDLCELRLATEAEKQQLFDALAKEGKRWDAEKKQIVDLKPKIELKPFDKVLSRRCSEDYWVLNFYSHKSHKTDYHICIDGSSNLYCIPYNEETAHLLGTTDEWKGGEG